MLLLSAAVKFSCFFFFFRKFTDTFINNTSRLLYLCVYVQGSHVKKMFIRRTLVQVDRSELMVDLHRQL